MFHIGDFNISIQDTAAMAAAVQVAIGAPLDFMGLLTGSNECLHANMRAETETLDAKHPNPTASILTVLFGFRI